MIDPKTDRVLITGAAGAIGTALRDGLRANWRRLHLTDIRPVQNLADNEEAIVADIADRAALEAMMHDVRAVVHLAGVLGNYDLEALFRVNARGLFDVSNRHGSPVSSASSSPAATTPSVAIPSPTPSRPRCRRDPTVCTACSRSGARPCCAITMTATA
jgi:uncharacterized protein YbjT (DUF2867 family)